MLVLVLSLLTLATQICMLNRDCSGGAFGVINQVFQVLQNISLFHTWGPEYLLELLQHHTEPSPIANDHMSTQKTVKVAAVQAAPVAFDLPKTLMKVAHFAAEAAKAGADLVVFP